MLSFLYRLSLQFEREHGYRPNRLYLSHLHFARLRSQLDAIRGLSRLECFLGMEIVLSADCLHPRLAWTDSPSRPALAG